VGQRRGPDRVHQDGGGRKAPRGGRGASGHQVAKEAKVSEKPGNPEQAEKRVESLSANATDTQAVRLRPLPVGAAGGSCRQGNVRAGRTLQTADRTKEAHERLIVLWMKMSKKIRAAGLGEAEVKAAVAQVTGADASSCASTRATTTLPRGPGG
jgi:hypothetical protein